MDLVQFTDEFLDEPLIEDHIALHLYTLITSLLLGL